MADIGGVLLGKDGKSYTYGGGWILSDLFLVEGLMPTSSVVRRD